MITSLAALLPKISVRPGVATRSKLSGQWIDCTWSELYLQIIKLASSLNRLGIKAGDRVAIISNTRAEWGITDFALMGMGVVSVPIYHTSTSEEVKLILQETGCESVVVENRALLKLVAPHKDVCPQFRRCIIMDGILEQLEPYANGLQIEMWRLLTDAGTLEFQKEFERRCDQIKSTDPLSILFTSGTSGQPKGVVLNHGNATSEVLETFKRLSVTEKDSTLSFLPFSHILGRIENWGQLAFAYTINYAESLEKIREDLEQVKPTILVAVPRIFEKIYIGIEGQLSGNHLQRAFAGRAFKLGLDVMERVQYRRPVPILKALEFELLKPLIFDKVKNIFGGKLRFAVSGGAPLNPEIAQFFHSCGILILEGYGLSETTAAITVNTPTAYQFGTVGKPIGDVQLKFANDGEILVRSRKVMQGYLNDESETGEAFEDGWFKTGDIGELTASGFLKITDRKKDLIKTAGGKYVAPQKLEVLLKTHPPISYVLIHGDQEKYVTALITLDKNELIKWAQSSAVDYKDYEALTQSTQVFELVRTAIAEINSQLASFETIKRFKILPREFSIESGEITPSLKVKRKLLDQKFAEEIKKLYQ